MATLFKLDTSGQDGIVRSLLPLTSRLGTQRGRLPNAGKNESRFPRDKHHNVCCQNVSGKPALDVMPENRLLFQ